MVLLGQWSPINEEDDPTLRIWPMACGESFGPRAIVILVGGDLFGFYALSVWL